MTHKERAHSKFSASGAVRWINCSGSVSLSEGLPDKSSPFAREGTFGHEQLENVLKSAIKQNQKRLGEVRWPVSVPSEMRRHVTNAANFILGLHAKTPGSELQIESRVYLDWIHPEMFGTLDSAVLDYFGTLHILDFKYGAGHAVSPKKNLQMVFYALAVAHAHHWNFKRVKIWIIQPRIKGYDGPVFWDIPIEELRSYVDVFREGVARVEREPKKYTPGSHCHWCRAKGICPAKFEKKIEKARDIFKAFPIKERKNDGEEKEESDEENFEEVGRWHDPRED